MNSRKAAAALIAAVLFGAVPAQATIYEYSAANPAGNDAAGNVTSILATYDTVTEVFTWEYTIEDVGGALSNGFTLAVNNGPNPKGTTGELALLYGDIDTGAITVYEYNGQNNATSFSTPGNFIGSFALSSTDAGTSSRTVSFSFDASSINGLGLSPDWTGVQFDSLIGYWFHPLLGADFSYSGDELAAVNLGVQGWYDFSDQTTTEIPEPSTIALLGAALLGLPRLRKRSGSTAAR